MHAMPPAIEKLLISARLKHIPKNQIILYQDDHPLEVYIIKSGIIKIHNIDNGGNEKILHILGKGSLIPFVFLSGKNNATKWFYSALTDCDLYVLPKEKLQHVMDTDATTAM